MNKILLPLLLALPALAADEVKFYGELKSGVETAHTRIGGRSISQTGVADFGSRIGLKGSHPIGGSNRVLWQLEEDAPVGRTYQRQDGFKHNSGGESYIGFGS